MNSIFDKILRKFINLLGLKNENYNKFILIGRGRTGSNLLLTTLNQHPNCVAMFEEFGTKKPRPAKKEELKKIFKKYPAYIKSVGFKIFYHHAIPNAENFWDRPAKGQIWEELGRDKSIKVIHLKRRNYFETLVSEKIAERRNKWFQMDNEPEDDEIQVNITVENCVEFFEHTKKLEKIYDDLFFDHKKIEIQYDDLKNNFSKTIKQTFDFLKLDRREIDAPIKKQRNKQNHEYVQNCEFLKEHFSNTEWAKFFK